MPDPEVEERKFVVDGEDVLYDILSYEDPDMAPPDAREVNVGSYYIRYIVLNDKANPKGRPKVQLLGQIWIEQLPGDTARETRRRRQHIIQTAVIRAYKAIAMRNAPPLPPPPPPPPLEKYSFVQFAFNREENAHVVLNVDDKYFWTQDNTGKGLFSFVLSDYTSGRIRPATPDMFFLDMDGVPLRAEKQAEALAVLDELGISGTAVPVAEDSFFAGAAPGTAPAASAGPGAESSRSSSSSSESEDDDEGGGAGGAAPTTSDVNAHLQYTTLLW